jgi:uncharacterized cupin superfamily protein
VAYVASITGRRYLEIGDRTPGDEDSYPRDDLKASLGPDGKWQFKRKDGTGY